MVLRRGGAAPLVVADSGWRWAGLSRAGQLAADGGLPRVMEGFFFLYPTTTTCYNFQTWCRVSSLGMPSHAVSLRCEPITARRRRARTLHLSHFFDRALPALLVSTSFLKEMFVAITTRRPTSPRRRASAARKPGCIVSRWSAVGG